MLMLLLASVTLGAIPVLAADPHRADDETNADPTFCMKSWSPAICTISTIAIIGALILLVFLVLGGWRSRTWLRERKLRKKLGNAGTEAKTCNGEVPSTPQYPSGPAAFRAPARPSSVISVLKRSQKGMPSRSGAVVESPCSTRPLVTPVAPSPVIAPAAYIPVSYGFHMPRRPMQAPHASTAYSPSQAIVYTSPLAANSNAADSGATTSAPLNAFAVSATSAHAEVPWQFLQHAAAPPIIDPRTTSAFSSGLPPNGSEGPLMSHANARAPGSDTTSLPLMPAITPFSVPAGLSIPETITPPQPVFNIPVSPAVQRVRAVSMMQPAKPSFSKRATYHGSDYQQYSNAPPPLPPIQTMNLTDGTDRKRSVERLTKAPKPRRTQSSGAALSGVTATAR